jgi:hypothetical protein
MRSANPNLRIVSWPTLNGKIDGNGTVSARQIGYFCRYDLIWRKSK